MVFSKVRTGIVVEGLAGSPSEQPHVTYNGNMKLTSRGGAGYASEEETAH